MPSLAFAPFAIQAGANIASNLFGQKKDSLVSTLDPVQQGVRNQLGSVISSRLGQGDQGYQGQLTEPISDAELRAISQFGGFTDLSNARLRSLINPDYNAFNQQFNAQVFDPAFNKFRSDVLPSILEDSPGFSTALIDARRRATENFVGGLEAQRFQANQAAQDRSLGAIGAGQSLNLANLGVQGLPRELKQAGLDREVANYIQGNQIAQNNMNAALGFLGIQTQALQQGGLNTFGKIAQAIGQGAQAYGSYKNNQALIDALSAGGSTASAGGPVRPSYQPYDYSTPYSGGL